MRNTSSEVLSSSVLRRVPSDAAAEPISPSYLRFQPTAPGESDRGESRQQTLGNNGEIMPPLFHLFTPSLPLPHALQTFPILCWLRGEKPQQRHPCCFFTPLHHGRPLVYSVFFFFPLIFKRCYKCNICTLRPRAYTLPTPPDWQHTWAPNPRLHSASSHKPNTSFISLRLVPPSRQLVMGAQTRGCLGVNARPPQRSLLAHMQIGSVRRVCKQTQHMQSAWLTAHNWRKASLMSAEDLKLCFLCFYQTRNSF